MAIKIKTQVRINPLDAEATKKYYATAVSIGELSFTELAKRIQNKSAIHKADITRVLVALSEVIPEALEEGYIVRLNFLGSLRVTVRSDPSPKPEDVSVKNVKQIRLHFSPDKYLKSTINNLKTEKI